MAEFAARTALGHSADALWTHGDAGTVAIRELPFSGAVALRIADGDAAARAAAEKALGAALPSVPVWVESGEVRVLWQAYDEWLVLTPDVVRQAYAAGLDTELAGCHAAVTDVSDLRAGFEIAGPRAEDVLRKGCAVDFHPAVFGDAACAVTALARIRVTVHRAGGGRWHVWCERSYAAYLRDWLADAAVEYLTASR